MNKKIKNNIIIILFLLPALILFTLFVLYPVFDTFALSLHRWKGIYGSPRIFVGFQNYREVLGSKRFIISMWNAIKFMIGGFIVLMPLSFSLALLITSKLKGTKIMKTAYFMPVMLSTSAVALMWVYILHPSYGALNKVLDIAGLGFLKREWLSTPGLNVWSIVMVNEWMYAGYNMLIFAAGLVQIPDSIYEAATLDGCTGIKKIIHISIPLCKESFSVFSILCITGCLKAFDLVWAMTKGGPNHTSETPATLLYNDAFTFKAFGKSAAEGVILLILGIVLSIALTKIFNKEKKYEMS